MVRPINCFSRTCQCSVVPPINLGAAGGSGKNHPEGMRNDLPTNTSFWKISGIATCCVFFGGGWGWGWDGLGQFMVS